MTYIAFLRGIGAFHSGGLYASFGGVPGNLTGEMCQVGGIQIGVLGARVVLHGGNRQLFVSDLSMGMLIQAQVDRAIDLLSHMAGEALPALAARGREFPSPFLLETFA